MNTVKDDIDNLLGMHKELIQAQKTVERVKQEMTIQVRDMKLLPNKTYRYIHEGQMVIVNTKAHGTCPQICLPEVLNTEYESQTSHTKALVETEEIRSSDDSVAGTTRR